MSAAGIPTRYQEGDWDRVDVPGALNIRHQWEQYIDRGKGILMAGPPGTGKSTLAALYAREALRKGHSVGFEYVPTMLDALEFDKRRKFETLQHQEHVGLLVWDDFLVDRLADWQIGLLDRIVERRYRSRKSMIITTNIDPAIIKQDDRLARMMDRWRQSCVRMDVDGPSLRKPEAL